MFLSSLKAFSLFTQSLHGSHFLLEHVFHPKTSAHSWKTCSRTQSINQRIASHINKNGRQFRHLIIFSFLTLSLIIALMVNALASEHMHTDGDNNKQTPSPSPTLVTIDDVHTGSFLFTSQTEGQFVEAPRLMSDFKVDITGSIARIRVTQRFQNPTDGWVEGIYVFPLTEKAAVDTLKMQIGDRFIEGKINERQQARALYENAKKSGQKASLVEQHRPNIFINSVANIGPGETIIVQIEYQQTIRQSDGQYSFRLPLVVAPRYAPTPYVIDEIKEDRIKGKLKSNPHINKDVSTEKTITPPVLDPKKHTPINLVSISIDLKAGFPLGVMKSHHHALTITKIDESHRRLTLKTETTAADRDFELTWRAADHVERPKAALFRQKTSNGDYFLAFITPPQIAKTAYQTPTREVVFVLDTSGSMAGTSIEQAKLSLIAALKRLSPRDHFNIIRFSSDMDKVFPESVIADRNHLAMAERFITSLTAEGGTEMLPALRTALGKTLDITNEETFLKQVIFITDGAVSNEKQLFDTIATKRGEARLFTIGIGSAPNSFFMNRAAEIGQGTHTHIGSIEQVSERMSAFLEKIEAPVVTNFVAHFTDASDVDLAPNPLPDLYRGEPVIITAHGKNITGELIIKGIFNGEPWTVQLDTAKAITGTGIDKLWARRKIASLEAERSLHKKSEKIEQTILDTALKAGIVSRLTSLVAIDVPVSRNPDKPLTSKTMPLNLPAGWEFDKVFGKDHLIDMKIDQQDARFNTIQKQSQKRTDNRTTIVGNVSEVVDNSPVIAAKARLSAAPQHNRDTVYAFGREIGGASANRSPQASMLPIPKVNNNQHNVPIIKNTPIIKNEAPNSVDLTKTTIFDNTKLLLGIMVLVFMVLLIIIFLLWRHLMRRILKSHDISS